MSALSFLTLWCQVAAETHGPEALRSEAALQQMREEQKMDLFNLEDESIDTEDLCTGELLLATILNTQLVSDWCNFTQC